MNGESLCKDEITKPRSLIFSARTITRTQIYGNAHGFFREVLPLDRRAAFNIPDHEIEALARCFLPDIIAYFESEEGKAEFATWKAEQEKLEAEKKTRKTKNHSNVGEYER